MTTKRRWPNCLSMDTVNLPAVDLEGLPRLTRGFPNPQLNPSITEVLRFIPPTIKNDVGNERDASADAKDLPPLSIQGTPESW